MSLRTFSFIVACSLSVVFSLDPYEQANWDTLDSYISAIQNQNWTGALNFVSTDVTYQVHANPRLVSWGGTYTGKTGASNFFTQAFASLYPFELSEFTTLVLQNDTAFGMFQQEATVKSTTRTFLIINAIIYTFNSQSMISYVDYFYDSALVADSYCLPSHDLSCAKVNSKDVKDNFQDTYHFTTPASSTTLSPHEQANFNTLATYLNFLGTGDIPSAINQTSENVTYVMHAYPALVPTAGGTWTGHSGATNFFTNTSADFSSFQLINPLIRALLNNTALVTFLEKSTTKNTNQSYQQVNNVIYTFENATNKILQVDIYFDSTIVGQALQCKQDERLDCSQGYGLSPQGVILFIVLTFISALI